MGEFKEKVLYYLEIYKKQIIIGGIISIFLITSIIIYFCFINNEQVDTNDNIIVEEIVKDKEDEEKEQVKNEEVKKEEIVVNSSIIKEKNEIIKKVIVDIKGEVKKPGVYEIDENKRINDVIKMAGGLTSNASTLVNNLSRKVKDEMVIIIYSKNDIEDLKNKKEEENKLLEEFNKVEDVIINDSVIIENDIDSNTNIENSINNENNNKIEDDKIDENNNDKNESNKEENKEDVEVDNNSKISINTATKDELMLIDGVGEKKADAIIEYRNSNGNFQAIEDIMNVSGIGESMFNKIKDKITI